jgi:AcrR family transcriptional regulator
MSARERILDAAASVMHERGLAAATTKEIARAAGYSEATLYKHFSDKQQIFLSVLKERVPAVESADALIGARTVVANLERIVTQLLSFYMQTFPMAASIFSSPQLLEAQRNGMRARQAGPEGPVRNVAAYLEGERAGGRIAESVDSQAIARLLAGACMQQAFFANFDGLDIVPDAPALAKSLVAALEPSLAIAR